MKPSCLAMLAAVLVLVLVTPTVLARPPHRQKRVSDQRLGELEALLALKKLRGKLVTVPVGFGQINPNDYGRKRRSAAPHSGALLLERLLEALPQDDLDAYDDDDSQQQHWSGSERLSPAFNRPVTE